MVVCALASEARALIEHWRLPRRLGAPFRLYDDGHRCVVLSGIGCIASATAVGFTAAHLPVARWFNFGLAGHASLSLGTVLLADSIAHRGRDDAWYPAPLPALRCARAPVLTHDEVVQDYPREACCDMEASAFMAAVSRVGREDRAQVVKVVSDNAQSGPALLDRARIEALAAAAAPTLLACMALPPAEPTPQADDALAPLLARWRFSHAQQAQLRLIHRRLGPTAATRVAESAAQGSAAAALALLRAWLAASPAA